MIARAISAAAGALTVPAVYLLGRRYNRRVGLVAALFWAVAYLSARKAHFGKPDSAVLFLVGAVVVYFRLRERSRTGDVVSAGFLIGLALGTKLNTLPLVVPLALTCRTGPALGLALATACGGFLLTNPFAVVDGRQFFQDMTTVAAIPREERLPDLPPGWIHQLRFSLPYGLGIPLFLSSLAGLAMAALRRQQQDLLLLSFPVVYFLIFGASPVSFARYVLPVIPFLAVLGALALERACQRLLPPRTRDWALAFLAVAVAWSPAVEAVGLNRLLSREDTRVLAVRWIHRHIPENRAVLFAGRFGLPNPRPEGFPYRVQGLEKGRDLGEEELARIHPACVRGAPSSEASPEGAG